MLLKGAKLSIMMNNRVAVADHHMLDLTVLERCFKHQTQQDHHFTVTTNNVFSNSLLPTYACGEALTHPLKPDPDYTHIPIMGSGFQNANLDHALLSRTSSCPPSPAAGRENSKKRKDQNPKGVGKDGSIEKRIKVTAEDGEESNMTEQNTSKSSKRETSGDSSKASEVQKTDYIHVRARRGQATDSHSLAERVRREKISERMKYLQDLVPGCNKIIGKAGMLDEIINYVQSLQRQVEFLSMKLATVYPILDFNIDNLFAKEAFHTDFLMVEMSSSDLTNTANYHQFNPVEQVVSCCGLDMGINPDMGQLRQTISAPVPAPENFIDTSCFTTQVQPPSTWDADLQNLYNVAFDH